MATKYFRITGYHPTDNYCFIMDSNGMFEKMWQFSSFLIQKGLKVLEVSNDEQFKDIDIKRAEENTKQIYLRANAKGKPEYSEKIVNGISCKVVTVGGKSYIPNITQ